MLVGGVIRDLNTLATPFIGQNMTLVGFSLDSEVNTSSLGVALLLEALLTTSRPSCKAGKSPQ